MARGSIIKRCPSCGNRARSTCAHKEARYAVAYYVGTKQVWETVGPSKHLAEKRLTERMNEIHSGTYQSPKPIHFSPFAEEFLRDYAATKVRPSTLETYRHIISGRFNPAFGHLPLTQITTKKVEEFLSSLEREHGLSRKTVNNSLILLKTMFKTGKRWGYLRSNPSEGIKRLTVDQKEMDCLTPAEIQVLLKYAEEPYRTLFLTAVLTGMRQGELLGLQWGDIDFVRNQIYVRRSVYWRERKIVKSPTEPTWIFSNLKTKSSRRTVIISPELRKALEEHQIRCPVSPWDLVFCHKDGHPFEPSTVLIDHFRATLKRAGVRQIRFHDLRHTYATLLISQGENIKFIQSQLGHASATMTLDRYGHLLPNAHQGVGERLDRLIFSKNPANVALRNPSQSEVDSGGEQQGGISVTIEKDNG